MTIFNEIAEICNVSLERAREIKQAMNIRFSSCSHERFRTVALNARDLLDAGLSINTAHCYSGCTPRAMIADAIAEAKA